MERRKKSDRREFLKQGLVFSAAMASTSLLSGLGKVFAQEALPDLVAVRNGEPDVLFDQAIAAMGGMKNFVKPGQTVVVKPNIASVREPETGGNTNPLLVKRIIEHCREAGAKKIYVFDNSGDQMKYCYEKSGIELAAKLAGATVVAGNNFQQYQKVTIPNGKALKETYVHELILQSDVYINVPVLKHHVSTGLTMAMKNQMGVVWGRNIYHQAGLHQCIADFCLFKKPDLNVLDAYRVILRNGPASNSLKDIELRKSLFISKDVVAIDAAGARMMGVEPKDIDHILFGHEAKIGNMNLDRLTIRKITL